MGKSPDGPSRILRSIRAFDRGRFAQARVQGLQCGEVEDHEEAGLLPDRHHRHCAERGALIAEPGGEVWINPTGGASLASGGSGDVLTGTIAAFLAQGLEPVRAAIAGCWLHGRAGELGSAVYPAAVPAAELPSFLAQAWRELESL